jgi:hypothetical protein
MLYENDIPSFIYIQSSPGRRWSEPRSSFKMPKQPRRSSFDMNLDLDQSPRKPRRTLDGDEIISDAFTTHSPESPSFRMSPPTMRKVSIDSEEDKFVRLDDSTHQQIRKQF